MLHIKIKHTTKWSAVSGENMANAGTQTWRDTYDVTRIPFWGDLRNSERYQQLNKALENNPQVTNLTAHSLGGSVILENCYVYGIMHVFVPRSKV